MKSLIYLVKNTSPQPNVENNIEESTEPGTTLQSDSGTGKPPPKPTFK